MSDTYSRRRLQSASITTVVSLSLVLFMLGLLGLLVLNTKRLSDYVKENIGFRVILRDGADEAEIIRLKKTLDVSRYVKSTAYITKELAEKEFKKNVDPKEDFTSFLDGHNPLPASLDVRLKAHFANPDSLRWIIKFITGQNVVSEVWYQKSLVDQVNKNIRKAGIVILGFSGLLMLIALALINNTIRLSIYSKRFLIKTMQLVGATQGFIRRPFIFNGIKHGIFGALIASGLLGGILYFAELQLPEINLLQDVQMLGSLFGIVLALGIIVSGISTSLAVRKYLRLRTEELYY